MNPQLYINKYIDQIEQKLNQVFGTEAFQKNKNVNAMLLFALVFLLFWMVVISSNSGNDQYSKPLISDNTIYNSPTPEISGSVRNNTTATKKVTPTAKNSDNNQNENKNTGSNSSNNNQNSDTATNTNTQIVVVTSTPVPTSKTNQTVNPTVTPVPTTVVVLNPTPTNIPDNYQSFSYTLRPEGDCSGLNSFGSGNGSVIKNINNYWDFTISGSFSNLQPGREYQFWFCHGNPSDCSSHTSARFTTNSQGQGSLSNVAIGGVKNNLDRIIVKDNTNGTSCLSSSLSF